MGLSGVEHFAANMTTQIFVVFEILRFLYFYPKFFFLMLKNSKIL